MSEFYVGSRLKNINVKNSGILGRLFRADFTSIIKAMRSSVVHIALFIALSIAFSGLTACTDTANSQKGSVDEKTTTPVGAANTADANSDTAGKSSEYPPAPTGIMQADIKNLDGSLFKVEDRKGKVVLLNLWATWCGPCRQEMPELVAMENEYKDKNFSVIGLNTDDESADDIKSFAESMKLNYELAWADEKLIGQFFKTSKFGGIPQSFLIDREGHLRGVFVGGGPKVIKQLRENVEKVVSE